MYIYIYTYAFTFHLTLNVTDHVIHVRHVTFVLLVLLCNADCVRVNRGLFIGKKRLA